MVKAEVPQLHRAQCVSGEQALTYTRPSGKRSAVTFSPRSVLKSSPSSPVTSDLRANKNPKGILNQSQCWYQGEGKTPR